MLPDRLNSNGVAPSLFFIGQSPVLRGAWMLDASSVVMRLPEAGAMAVALNVPPQAVDRSTIPVVPAVAVPAEAEAEAVVVTLHRTRIQFVCDCCSGLQLIQQVPLSQTTKSVFPTFPRTHDIRSGRPCLERFAGGIGAVDFIEHGKTLVGLQCFGE
jgi:hypothetical protein